jgi:hypothetical protein
MTVTSTELGDTGGLLFDAALSRLSLLLTN